MRKEGNRAGDALASALGGTAGPRSADAGRFALLTLVRLHELGALTFSDGSELSTVPGPIQPGAVVTSDPAQAGQTGHPCNMASLFASEGDSK